MKYYQNESGYFKYFGSPIHWNRNGLNLHLLDYNQPCIIYFLGSEIAVYSFYGISNRSSTTNIYLDDKLVLENLNTWSSSNGTRLSYHVNNLEYKVHKLEIIDFSEYGYALDYIGIGSSDIILNANGVKNYLAKSRNKYYNYLFLESSIPKDDKSLYMNSIHYLNQQFFYPINDKPVNRFDKFKITKIE